MKLYFLRHGQADWPGWKKPDDERPLTKHGKREMRDVAKFLDRLKVRPDFIVTSPLPRAAQTAEIAADYLKAKVRKDESLAPGFGRSKLRTVVKRHRANVLMLVGHEPGELRPRALGRLLEAVAGHSQFQSSLVEAYETFRRRQLGQ